MLAHSLDTLVHSRTRWSTPFTVLQFDWDPLLSADFPMSSSKYMSVLCLVPMSSSKLLSMSSSKYVSVLCLVSMSSSTESRYWPSLVLNKIRSLWSIGASAAGLNQLAGRTPSLACVIVCMSCCCRNDEGGSIRPVGHTKKSSQSDLYMRLGLLLGDNARRASRSAALSPPPRRPGSSTNHSHGSCASFSSLASLEATTLTSTNTSPVSTLTGNRLYQATLGKPPPVNPAEFRTSTWQDCMTSSVVGSSEADVHSHARTLKDPSSDSITSLMSVSGQSNCSSSPVSRRHSVTSKCDLVLNLPLDVGSYTRAANLATMCPVSSRSSSQLGLTKCEVMGSTGHDPIIPLCLCSSASQPGRVEELNIFKNRRTSIRRSARTGSVKGPIDPKGSLDWTARGSRYPIVTYELFGLVPVPHVERELWDSILFYSHMINDQFSFLAIATFKLEYSGGGRVLGNHNITSTNKHLPLRPESGTLPLVGPGSSPDDVVIVAVRFAQYRAPQLTLKPLFFEVPLQEPDPLFLGRHWLIREMEEALGTSQQPGVLVVGGPGTGKTALVLQLVELSCFGRRREPSYQQGNMTYQPSIQDKQDTTFLPAK
uniref:Uncharacterized protein n=1 Tax=Timema cristinae TaxID=61476 RepID=A0A7R9CN47_TIMCR|nr:unnamed protein product [Timema cristinae]